VRNIIITVVGTQKDAAGEENRIELVSPGKHYHKNGVDYFIYKETAISGMEGTTTTIKLYPDHVTIVRTGSIQHRQEFRLHSVYHSTYMTAFGKLKMSVYTNNLEVNFVDSAGSVNIGYELAINGKWQSTNTLAITIREDNSNGYQTAAKRGN